MGWQSKEEKDRARGVRGTQGARDAPGSTDPLAAAVCPPTGPGDVEGLSPWCRDSWGPTESSRSGGRAWHGGSLKAAFKKGSQQDFQLCQPSGGTRGVQGAAPPRPL